MTVQEKMDGFKKAFKKLNANQTDFTPEKKLAAKLAMEALAKDLEVVVWILNPEDDTEAQAQFMEPSNLFYFMTKMLYENGKTLDTPINLQLECLKRMVELFEKTEGKENDE